MTFHRYAILFPGQGSQSTGMLAEAYSNFSTVRETFVEASDILGIDLWSLTLDPDDTSLNLTENTQPILLASSVGLWRELMRRDTPLPMLLAGHSLGEFSALVCAEALDFSDAVDLVHRRGKYMQQAVPLGSGAMAAILGLEDDLVKSKCHEISVNRSDNSIVSAVNYNSPGQIVIAGHKVAVDEAVDSFRKIGAKKAITLPVSAPFHTSLMCPAGEKLSRDIEKISFRKPRIDVLSNVNAKVQRDPGIIKKLLVEQISSPVLWSDCMRYIIANGFKFAFECGSGKVLSGLCKRINKSFLCRPLENPDNFDSLAEMIP